MTCSVMPKPQYQLFRGQRKHLLIMVRPIDRGSFSLQISSVALKSNLPDCFAVRLLLM